MRCGCWGLQDSNRGWVGSPGYYLTVKTSFPAWGVWGVAASAFGTGKRSCLPGVDTILAFTYPKAEGTEGYKESTSPSKASSQAWRVWEADVAVELHNCTYHYTIQFLCVALSYLGTREFWLYISKNTWIQWGLTGILSPHLSQQKGTEIFLCKS